MPLLRLLVIHKRHQVREHPVVAVRVYDDVIGLAGLPTVFDHVSVFPPHLARLRIHADELTVARCHE